MTFRRVARREKEYARKMVLFLLCLVQPARKRPQRCLGWARIPDRWACDLPVVTKVPAEIGSPDRRRDGVWFACDVHVV